MIKTSTHAWLMSLLWLDLLAIELITGTMSNLTIFIMALFPCVWFIISSYYADRQQIIIKKLFNLCDLIGKQRDDYSKVFVDLMNSDSIKVNGKNKAKKRI